MFTGNFNRGPAATRNGFNASARPVRTWSRPDIIIDEPIEYRWLFLA